MTLMCIPCNLEFKTDQMYRDHKAVVHGGYAPDHGGQIADTGGSGTNSLRPLSNPIDDLPAIIKPTPKPIMNNPIVPQATEQKVIPMKLTYKYEGTCPVHKCPIVTVLLPIEGSLYAVALCSLGSETITSRKVTDLAIEKKPRKSRSIKSKEVKK